MQLLQAWKELLAMVWPKNLLLFLKQIARLLGATWRYWGLFICLLLPIVFLTPAIESHVEAIHVALKYAQKNSGLLWLKKAFWTCIMIGLTLFAILMSWLVAIKMHALVQKKPRLSIMRYCKALVLVSILFLMLIIFSTIISTLSVTPFIGKSIGFLYRCGMQAMILFFLFFFLDSFSGLASSARSLLRALKMVVYTYPLACIIFGALFFVQWALMYMLPPYGLLDVVFRLSFFGSWLHMKIGIGMWLHRAIIFFVDICFAACIVTMYSKQIQEHPSRYQ